MILDNLRELEEAYRNKWILSNSQVLALLKLQKLTSPSNFQGHGFLFQSDRQQQQGQQKGWLFSKLMIK